jgi:pyruvate dehydrogenase E1 component alpha subunit
VHTAARAAVDRARRGEGPSLIEAETMRMLGHAVHDGAEYVPRDLLSKWEMRDPIRQFRERLLSEGTPVDQLEAFDRRCREEVEDAVSFAEASPWPDPASVTDGVYAP